MGMSIEETIESFENMKALVGANHFAIKMGIDTMRKYQKIQAIVKSWNDMNSFDSMVNISEVVEDGKA